MSENSQGHRARLWARFAEGGLRGAFVHPYEKLEFLLTFAIPRRDTKPLAKALLARFGSLNGVLTAPLHRLIEMEGIGEKTARFLKLLHEVALTLDEEDLVGRNLLSRPELVRNYVRRELAWEESEYMLNLYLDGRNRLIRKARLFRGTLDRVPHYPREVAKEALACNAAGVIVAHNHPSGKADPSTADVKATERVAAALETVGIRLVDHLVVGRERVVSLVECGLYRP